MTFRRSLAVRCVLLVFGTLQLALPGAVAMHDALLQARAFAGPGSHVEAESDPRCVPSHAPDCALCRYLQSDCSTPSEHGSLERPASAAGTRIPDPDVAGAFLAPRGKRPRAPP